MAEAHVLGKNVGMDGIGVEEEDFALAENRKKEEREILLVAILIHNSGKKL